MSPGGSPGRPREVRRDQDYAGVNAPLPPISSLRSNSSTFQSDHGQRDQRQGRHHEGVNTLLPPISTLLSNSSTSQSDRDQGDQRQRRHYEWVNTLLPPISTLLSNSSTSPSDHDQGDQRQRRHSEGVNALLPPISTLLSNSSTSQSYPDQQPTRSSAHPSSARTSSTSTSCTPRHRYTEEQDEAILYYRDDCFKTWTQVAEAYHSHCYPDGITWEQRSISALQTRYSRIKSAAAWSMEIYLDDKA